VNWNKIEQHLYLITVLIITISLALLIFSGIPADNGYVIFGWVLLTIIISVVLSYIIISNEIGDTINKELNKND
jgi:hypothetical protein